MNHHKRGQGEGCRNLHGEEGQGGEAGIDKDQQQEPTVGPMVQHISLDDTTDTSPNPED